MQNALALVRVSPDYTGQMIENIEVNNGHVYYIGNTRSKDMALGHTPFKVEADVFEKSITGIF